MGIKELLQSIKATEESELSLDYVIDSIGINFTTSKQNFGKIEEGDAAGWVLHQYACLASLVEEGLADKLANGFTIPADLAIQLDSDARCLLDLPGQFYGSYGIHVEKLADDSCFKVEVIPILPDGDKVPHYKIFGPMLKLSDNEEFMMSPSEYLVFSELENHNKNYGANSEARNLRLIAQFQRAKKHGLAIDLSHFNNIEVIEPEKVRIAIKTLEDGSFLLLPDYQNGIDPLMVGERLGQLKQGKDVGSLRVGDMRISLDEISLAATKEILENKNISKDQVKSFLKNPTAFINGALVDLDVGFSLRVVGAEEFKPHYFGDTDESGIDWFSVSSTTTQLVQPSKLEVLLTSQGKAEEFRKVYELAMVSGKSVVQYSGKTIDISEPHKVDSILEKIEQKLAQPPGEEGSDNGTQPSEPESKLENIVLAITENDLKNDFGLDKRIEEISYDGDIDWNKLCQFDPYKYQDAGVRWILGLAEDTIDIKYDDIGKYGALLADDMGLGKTFMSLAAIALYQKKCQEKNEKQRPTLVVAPLGLLEIWKTESQLVFGDDKSPFYDIVILQSQSDLKRFKVEGTGVETKQQGGVDLSSIRYALKVGKTYLNERLDMPGRLVITTYQTLRDYQFSLSRVDWSFVIFDEAQFIKNPNTLASRAAKALKARFKLVATGTPVENSLKDFWNLLDTARPGYMGAYQDFRDKYIRPIQSAEEDNKQSIRVQVGRDLRNDVGALMLRRIKRNELEGLPKKTIYVGVNSTHESQMFLEKLKCKMSDIQQAAYDDVIDVVNESTTNDGESAVLSGLQRLRDASLHPRLLECGTIPLEGGKDDIIKVLNQSGKLKCVLSVLEDIKERQEKVIIFVINKRLQRFLSIALEKIFEIKVSIINGDTKATAKRLGAETRITLIKEFEKKNGFGVIIMSPIAAGMGLTIVGANNVIHLERHWNPAKEAQATDRVYRIGQERDVNIYVPILHHQDENLISFDVNLNRLLSQKTALQDCVITPEQIDPGLIGEGIFKTSHKTASPTIKEDELHTLSWEMFEAFCVELLIKAYATDGMLTKSGSDKGADIILRGTVNAVVQVKHKQKRWEEIKSEEPIKEVLHGKRAYAHALAIDFDRMIVISNAKSYSKKILAEAKKFDVTMISISEIRKMMKNYTVTNKDVLSRLGKSRIEI